jgi:hypothetical protein
VDASDTRPLQIAIGMLNDVQSGEGVKTPLHELQRQSCTTSIFFLRVPFFATCVLAQFGQRSGCFSVWATLCAFLASRVAAMA